MISRISSHTGSSDRFRGSKKRPRPTPTPTPTPTMTPTSTSLASLCVVTNGLQLFLDAGNVNSYVGTGTTWNDLSVNSNHATLINGVGYNSNNSGALTFDGSNDYVDVNQSLSSESFTLSVWFKSSNVTQYGMLISKEETGGWPWNYRLYLAQSTGYLIGDIAQSGGSSISLQYATNLADGQWHNVSFIRSVTDDKIYLYVDGSKVSEGTDTLTGTISNSQEVWIGRSTFTGGGARPTGSYPFNGSISSVMIYNRDLSSSEILQNYNCHLGRFTTPTPTPTPSNTVTSTNTPTPTPSSTPSFVSSNLILHYDPSNSLSYPGTGTTITDLSGNGRNGTMSNILYESQYFTYNGSSSQVSIDDNSLLEPGTGDWSIEVWVNHSVIAGASRVLIAKTDGGNSADWGYGLRTISNSNTFIEAGNGTNSITSPSTGLSINTWYQVVGVWTNVASNSIDLYINGSLIGSNSHAFTSIKNTTSPLYLGSFNGGQFSQWFNGKMGIVRIYNKALTSSEVLLNYNNDITKYVPVTPTPTPTPTPTITNTPTPSVTTTVTPTITNTPTPSVTPTNTVTPSITPSQTFDVIYSQTFTQGVSPTNAQETAWNTFRSSLTGTYTSFDFYSNLTTGITVTDAIKVQTLANAIKNATVTNQTIGSNTWYVGVGCGTPKIGGTAVEFSNVGSCTGSSTYSLRPMINNQNWGGVNGTTANAATQTITLRFY